MKHEIFCTHKEILPIVVKTHWPIHLLCALRYIDIFDFEEILYQFIVNIEVTYINCYQIVW